MSRKSDNRDNLMVGAGIQHRYIHFLLKVKHKGACSDSETIASSMMVVKASWMLNKQLVVRAIGGPQAIHSMNSEMEMDRYVPRIAIQPNFEMELDHMQEKILRPNELRTLTYTFF